MSAARWLDSLILWVASAIGLVAFLYPFLAQGLVQAAAENAAHAQDAPLITIVIVVLCLGALMASLRLGGMNTKVVAILGVMTASNAVIRGVPGPAGFSLVFVLPILCGHVYGGTFGFLLGALSILVSAIIGAGIGPWLPYQMLVTGWVGLTSSWLPRLGRHRRLEVLMLGAWGLAWGFLFGVVMNIWFWPYVYQSQQPDLYWQPSLGLWESLRRYAVFYVLTSFWWDLGRAAGNVLVICLFGAAILRLLRRFQKRFRFVATAPTDMAHPMAEGPDAG